MKPRVVTSTRSCRSSERATAGSAMGAATGADGGSAAAAAAGVSGCAGADTVVMLKKMRVVLNTVSVEVKGERRAEHPKRYTALKYTFRFAGEGLDRSKAERAVNLSFEKYCSAIHTLAADIPVEHEIELL